MRMRMLAGLCTCLAIALASPAVADTVLATPVLRAAPTQSIRCEVMNASARAITVRIEIVDPFDAEVIASYSWDVDPWEGRALGVLGGVVFNRYCRFSGRFGKTAVRASGAVLSPDGLSTAVIVEAR